MAGLNADLERIRVWIEAGVRAASLSFKRPENLDDGGYEYTLTPPEIYLHAYPTNAMEDALPSALLELEEVTWTPDAVTYGLGLTLAVWDSGTHAEDRFRKDPQTGAWTRQSAGPYERADGSKGAAVDLCTFADFLARHFQREALSIGEGLQLSDAENLTFELIADDELSRSGFRFGRFSFAVKDPLPPAPMAISTPAEERAEDAQAPKISIDSLL